MQTILGAGGVIGAELTTILPQYIDEIPQGNGRFARITAKIAVRSGLAAYLSVTRLRTRRNRIDQDC
jgi:hypothetical protein